MGRLIDEDDVKRRMHETMDYQDLYLPVHFEMCMSDAPTIPAPRWVRVEDELPDIAVKVVAYAEGQIITAWRTFFSEPIGQWDTNDAVRIDNITHWMPLPEPPGEDA